MPKWEEDIDRSRENHRHHLIKGGFRELLKIKVKYCYPCDQYYLVSQANESQKPLP